LDCAITLPIELKNFEAAYSQEDRVVDLHWTTMSERDNAYFSVEKSVNGSTFYEISMLKGSGNSSSQIDYYTADTDPSFGINYYRLKQVDLNGEFTYSEVKSVNVLPDGMANIMLQPNPTTNITDMIYSCKDNETVYLSIYDMKGKLVEYREIISGRGMNYHTIDMVDYKNGVYFINLVTSFKTYTDKLIKE